jgi:hypothetical protein
MRISKECMINARVFLTVAFMALLPVLAIDQAMAQNLTRRAQELRAQYLAGNFEQVVAGYNNLAEDQREAPLCCYWAGQAYLRRHDFRSAEPLLRRSLSGALNENQQRAAQGALRRIDILKTLCPPFLKDVRLGGYSVTVFGQNTQWTGSVVGQLPRFLERAEAAFGNSSAHINFYLFDEREPYDKFFAAWQANGNEGDKHRGTGGVNLVMFCKSFPNGTVIGASDQNVLFFRVLHEYSHALCHTICGDTWAKVPQWLNEGMADRFASIYVADWAKVSEARLVKTDRLQWPTYEAISHQLYGVPEGYSISDAMVERLFQGSDISIYGRLVSTAKNNGGNFESALRQLNGGDARAVFSQVSELYACRR